MNNSSFTYNVIGYISSDFQKKYDAPRQPRLESENVESKIILSEGQNFEQALHDLLGFDFIWLIFAFHKNEQWKPKVLPPRTEKKKGVFATRSPHRPNAIGLSLVRLISISGREIMIGDHDLLDQTPILDIKPYLPHIESIPNAKYGWIEERNANRKNFDITWDGLASEQMQWLKKFYDIDFSSHAENILRHSPYPHPYNRITEKENGKLIFSYQDWRLLFEVNDNQVLIRYLFSGYTWDVLKNDTSIHNREVHERFYQKWI